MPILFTYARTPRRPKVVDPRNLSGEDISLRGGDTTITPAGDWATVTDEAAAKQSIIREAAAAPNSFVRRPDWGIGLEMEVRKPRGRSRRDGIISRARRRLAMNRRLSRIIKVDAVEFATDSGETATALEIQAEVGKRDSRIVAVYKPKGR